MCQTEPEATERTASQVVTQQAVLRVRARVTEREEPVSKLVDTVSTLAAGEERPNESRRRVEEAQKVARNLGEDLLEDLLSLDQLSDLFPEDKSARKAEIARIDSLLEVVDTTKAKLASYRRVLESKLGASPPVPTSSTPTAASVMAESDDARCMPDEGQRVSDGRDAATSAAEAVGPQVCGGCPAVAQQGTWEAELAAPDGTVALLAPSEEAWRRVQWPLQFQTQEGARAYVLVARAPGLDEKSLRLVLGNGGSTLTAEGARVPTASEAAQMQRAIAARHPLAATRRSPALDRLFFAMGAGTFGSFSQTIKLPGDAMVDGIQAKFEGGDLRVVIPRAQQRWLPTRGAPRVSQGAPWGHKGCGSPSRASHLGRGSYHPGASGLHGGLF